MSYINSFFTAVLYFRYHARYVRAFKSRFMDRPSRVLRKCPEIQYCVGSHRRVDKQQRKG